MADDPVELFDAADVGAVDNAHRDAARIAREDADVIRAIMMTKKGRAWMLRQLERCCVNSPQKFVPGHPDMTAHNLGRESYGLELLREVQAASVDLYMKGVAEMEEEARRRQEVRRSEAKRRADADRPPTAEDQVAGLPPPKGFPGHVPPPDLSRRGKKK
jgi:hypothetical protein